MIYQTPRRELKIRRVTDFWRTLRCLEIWRNIVLSVDISYQSKQHSHIGHLSTTLWEVQLFNMTIVKKIFHRKVYRYIYLPLAVQRRTFPQESPDELTLWRTWLEYCCLLLRPANSNICQFSTCLIFFLFYLIDSLSMIRVDWQLNAWVAEWLTCSRTDGQTDWTVSFSINPLTVLTIEWGSDQ